MNIGLDIGYSATKTVSGRRQVTFPSAVGTPEKARFSLGDNGSIVLVQPEHIQVGEGAVQQSRFLRRREDRKWVFGDEWYALFLAALTEVTKATRAEVHIVTGLPVAFFDDRRAMRDRLLGTHRVQREGRHAQALDVVECRVIPQPFGALLATCLDDKGRVVDEDLATGAVGVIDTGGKTTNLLSVSRLSEISRETASVNVGTWDAVRAVREWLNGYCPELELRDHQVIDAIIARQVRYYGQSVDLSEVVDAALAPLAEQVLAEATQLWNGAAALDAILVSGGGAHLLGTYIRNHFPHARVVEEPVFANALGFWRFCQRLADRVGVNNG
jgi:plasmid segregation protein ParM